MELFDPSKLIGRSKGSGVQSQLDSWLRSDEEFFAAGACHILAFAFLDLFKDLEFHAWFILPTSNFPGKHVFVANSHLAFDWRGFRRKQTSIDEYFESFRKICPGWDAAVQPIDKQQTCESFCRSHNHRLPSEFHQNPTQRAIQFIERQAFSSSVRATGIRTCKDRTI